MYPGRYKNQIRLNKEEFLGEKNIFKPSTTPTILVTTVVRLYPRTLESIKGFTRVELAFQSLSWNRFEETNKRTDKNRKPKMKIRFLVFASLLLVSSIDCYKISGSSNDKGQRCVTVQECPHLVQLMENGARVWSVHLQ